MKKTFIFIFIFFGLAVFPFLAGAKESKPQSDYLYNFDRYNLLHNEYIKAKKVYLGHRNLAAKSKALDAEKKALLARNETLTAYFLFLQDELSHSQRPEGMTKLPLANLISAQIDFLKINKQKLLAVDSIAGLNKISADLEAKETYWANLARLTRDHIKLGNLGFIFFRSRKNSYKLLFIAMDRLGENNSVFSRYSRNINLQLDDTLASWQKSSRLMGEIMDSPEMSRADWRLMEEQIGDLKSSLASFINFNQDMVSVLEK